MLEKIIGTKLEKIIEKKFIHMFAYLSLHDNKSRKKALVSQPSIQTFNTIVGDLVDINICVVEPFISAWDGQRNQHKEANALTKKFTFVLNFSFQL